MRMSRLILFTYEMELKKYAKNGTIYRLSYLFTAAKISLQICQIDSMLPSFMQTGCENLKLKTKYIVK